MKWQKKAPLSDDDYFQTNRNTFNQMKCCKSSKLTGRQSHHCVWPLWAVFTTRIDFHIRLDISHMFCVFFPRSSTFDVETLQYTESHFHDLNVNISRSREIFVKNNEKKKTKIIVAILKTTATTSDDAPTKYGNTKYDRNFNALPITNTFPFKRNRMYFNGWNAQITLSIYALSSI